MLAQRLTVAILLIPFGVALIYVGGWFFTIAAAAIFGYAAFEYWRLFRSGGYHPSAPVIVAGTAGLVLARQFQAFTAGNSASGNGSFFTNGLVFALIILLAMFVQVIAHERGSTTSSIDFNITLGGILYVGWLGSYFIALRSLPEGLWWLLVVLPACWLGDSAAYFVGTHFGKHPIAPRVSPKKTWEGYAGGVFFGSLLTMGLAALWSLRSPQVTPLRGLAIGLAVTAIMPLGDLGESMIKRGFGIKDSGAVLPGHGGILDRIDSWLWGIAIGYYIVTWFFL